MCQADITNKFEKARTMEQIIEELENIQTEIMLSVNSGKYSDVFRKGMIEAFDIIDKRIESLKGENNGTHNNP